MTKKDMTFVANWRGVGLSFFRLSLYPLVQPQCLLDGVPIAALAEIGFYPDSMSPNQ
jgi:hypothetical protein